MAKVAGQRRFHGIVAGQRTTPIMLCNQDVITPEACGGP